MIPRHADIRGRGTAGGARGRTRARLTPRWALALTVGVAASAAFAASSALATAAPRGLRLTESDGTQVEWWSETTAPQRWTGPGPLVSRAQWRRAHGGVSWAEFSVRGPGEASALVLVVVRIDPRQVQFSLQWASDRESGRPAWELSDAPGDAVIAVNAGMFTDALPWGWVVQGGSEVLPPGRGPLSSAFVVTKSGQVAMVDGDNLSQWRARGDVAAAFQTYPTLLSGDGNVPSQLRQGDSIDREHRDARLAIGLDREGNVLFALTRLDVALPGFDRLPVGLTVPEMAAVMGALGARQAALLDGGISAQLMLRDGAGGTREWKGMRRVPLALVARPR